MSDKPKLRRSPSSFQKPVQWMVETDYRHKLSPEEQEYLDKFNEAVAGNNGGLVYDDQKTVRDLYVEVKRQQRDALNFSTPMGPIDRDASASPEDAINEMLDRHKQALTVAAAEAHAAAVKRRRDDRRAKERKSAAAAARRLRERLARKAGKPK